MRTTQYNEIIRAEYPKWNGWKILDFYNNINIKIDDKEQFIIKLLEENFYLIKKLEKTIVK